MSCQSQFIIKILSSIYGKENVFIDYLNYLHKKNCIANDMYSKIIIGLYNSIVRFGKIQEIKKQFTSHNFIVCFDTYCGYKTFFSKCKQPKRFYDFEQKWSKITFGDIVISNSKNVKIKIANLGNINIQDSKKCKIIVCRT